MGLFKKKEKEPQTQTKISEENKKIYIIPYSKHFKGFKNFPVVVFGNDVSMENSEKLYNCDVSNYEFKFVCLNSYNNNGRFAFVYINNMQVGSVFDIEQINAIENGRIEKIHVEKKENDKRFSFFVKYI